MFQSLGLSNWVRVLRLEVQIEDLGSRDGPCKCVFVWGGVGGSFVVVLVGVQSFCLIHVSIRLSTRCILKFRDVE